MLVVVAGHNLDSLFMIICYLNQIHIFRRDQSLIRQMLLNPLKQHVPILFSYQHNRNTVNALSLNQSQALKHLIKGSKTAGKDDKALSILDEHHFPYKEIVKVDLVISMHIGIQPLLFREVYTETDRLSALIVSSKIRRLHNSRSPAGNHTTLAPGHHLSCFNGHLVILGVSSGSCGIEYGDAGTYLQKLVVAFQTLPHNFEDTPEIPVAIFFKVMSHFLCRCLRLWRGLAVPVMGVVRVLHIRIYSNLYCTHG